MIATAIIGLLSLMATIMAALNAYSIAYPKASFDPTSLAASDHTHATANYASLNHKHADGDFATVGHSHQDLVDSLREEFKGLASSGGSYAEIGHTHETPELAEHVHEEIAEMSKKVEELSAKLQSVSVSGGNTALEKHIHKEIDENRKKIQELREELAKGGSTEHTHPYLDSIELVGNELGLTPGNTFKSLDFARKRGMFLGLKELVPKYHEAMNEVAMQVPEHHRAFDFFRFVASKIKGEAASYDPKQVSEIIKIMIGRAAGGLRDAPFARKVEQTKENKVAVVDCFAANWNPESKARGAEAIARGFCDAEGRFKSQTEFWELLKERHPDTHAILVSQTPSRNYVSRGTSSSFGTGSAAGSWLQI